VNNLPDADARRRAHAAVLIASMRGNLASLEHYLANVPHDQLSGTYWAYVLEQADLAVVHAIRVATTHQALSGSPDIFDDEAAQQLRADVDAAYDLRSRRTRR